MMRHGLVSSADATRFVSEQGTKMGPAQFLARSHSWPAGRERQRGEYGERTASVPFHVVFSGSSTLRAALLKQLKEPLCDHEAELSVRVIRTPGGIAEAEAFRDAQRLLQGGADLELILLFLRDRGYGHVDSIYAVAALMNKAIPETKTLVDQSQTWSSQLREDEVKLREWARKALRDLEFS